MKHLQTKRTVLCSVLTLFILFINSSSYAQEPENIDELAGISEAEEEKSRASEIIKKPQQRCYEQAKPALERQPFLVCGAGHMVYDSETGLMWSRCTLGKHWNNESQSCEGDASTHDWKDALNEVSGLNRSAYLSHADWRLPNIKEMGSLVDLSCTTPAIDSTVFPDTDNSQFWTSTVFEQYPGRAWYYDFEFGNDYPANKRYYKQMRLVRLGKGLGSYNLARDSRSKEHSKGQPDNCVPLANAQASNSTPTESAPMDESSVNNVDAMVSPLEFNPITDVETSSIVTSDEVTVAVSTGSQSLQIENGEYQLNGNGMWTSLPGSVRNGDRVKVRHLSSRDYLTDAITTVTIGEESASFTSTTMRYVF